MAGAEGPCWLAKLLRKGARLRVDDEIDVALPIEHHVLRAVLRHERRSPSA